MISIDGFWFDGNSSAKRVAELHLDSQGNFVVVSKETHMEFFSGEQDAAEISSRLGDSPRYLNFAEGQSFETHDNDLVDQWVKHFRPSVFSNWVHRLETNYHFVALTLVMVIGVVWGTVTYVVPTASLAIAHTLPAEVLDQASKETLMLLDKKMLEPSRLSEDRQASLLKSFAPVIQQHEHLRIKVGFRYSDMGPNAFALPNGQIVFTDAIVKLAKNDQELVSVLAHEIGHVKYRHSLRSMLQGSIFLFVLAMITGDVSGVADLVLTLPVAFAELSYSRSYELESDNYARVYMESNQIPLHHFADLMLRFETYGLERMRKGAACDELEDLEKEACLVSAEDAAFEAAKTSGMPEGQISSDMADEGSDGIQWMRYLSTHPMTEDRVRAFLVDADLVESSHAHSQ
ncbi:MAG: M48 family metallopeptidase [Cellvibrionaceae bacterium]